MAIQERYNPIPAGVDSTTLIYGNSVAAFLAVTAGTITITNADGVVLLNAFPVTAGQQLDLRMNVKGSRINGPATVVLAGGAGGTLLV